jgi:hypothetical protein
MASGLSAFRPPRFARGINANIPPAVPPAVGAVGLGGTQAAGMSRWRGFGV